MNKEIKEFRPEGSRNFIRVGDRAKLLPGVGNKCRVEVTVRKLVETPSGIEAEVCICRITSRGTTQSKPGTIRTVVASRLERMAQTKDGKRRVVA